MADKREMTLDEHINNVIPISHSIHRELRELKEQAALVAPMLEALEKIARHSHCDYSVNGGGEYGTGITDGHRCAADIARAAIPIAKKEG